ncbi:hypothetical protein F2Q68_00024134 [Brassica cretica]|uniref:Uncharacterized protein n=1 Tax=Brassica cretica TaxID=69181 RepID=A0A8S9ID15_BRACR|nr:hypothetical protein F2Q68_00024134 [Brassica cretica]
MSTPMTSGKSLRRGERYTQRTSGIDCIVTPTQSFPEIGRDTIRINTVLGWNPEEKNRDISSSLEWRRKDHHDMSHDKSKNYTLRSENLRGKHWERPDKRLSTRRSPTDSQRTISDHFPSKWPRSYPGGRRSRSPPSQGKMEWRPVTRPRETEENSGTQRPRKETGNNGSPMEQSKTESSMVLRAQREANVTTKDHEPQGELEVEKEKEQNRKRRKKDKENEDVDLDISIDEYAEMAMNEEMIDAEVRILGAIVRLLGFGS